METTGVDTSNDNHNRTLSVFVATKPCNRPAAETFYLWDEEAVSDAALDDLLRRAAVRDPDALAELVDRYSDRVFGLLFRLTGSRDLAEDLMQDTFLRLVRTIESYEHTGRFEAWLFRIAANLARDAGRMRRRRGVASSLGEAPPGAVPLHHAGREAPTDPGDVVVSRELSERLAARMTELSAMDREILLLRHYAELSFREIAEHLRIPLGTALARAHRALQRLRVVMNDE